MIYEDYDGAVPLAELWEALRVKPTWIRELTALQLRFDGGGLKVASALADTPNLAQRLMDCYLYMFEFRSWSDTRWCGVGHICRRIVACLLLGLKDLVRFVLHRDGETDWYLKGFTNLNDNIVRMMCVCSLSAGVAEAPLKRVLEDDRMVRLLPQLDSLMVGEREKTMAIPMPIYELLAQHCSMESEVLASQVRHALAVQCGYAEMRVRTLRGFPWCLAVGNIPDNLAALQVGLVPAEETAYKIYTLLHAGVPIDALAPAVRMLGELPCTSKCAEQGHVLSSHLMQWHKQYTADTMTARTTVAAVKQLVGPSIDRAVRKVERCKSQLKRARKQQPSKLGARQLFCGALWKSARAKCGKQEFLATVRRNVLQRHGSIWKNKSVSERADYEDLARARRGQKLREQRDDVRRGVQDLSEAQRDLDQASLQGRSLRMSDCKWTSVQKVGFQELFESEDWTHGHVQQLREAAATTCTSMEEAKLAVLNSMPAFEQDVPMVEKPAWVGWMCSHREFFKGCVFKLCRAGEVSFFQFVFAQKSPSLICFVALEPYDLPVRLLSPLSFWDAEANTRLHTFKILWTFRYSDDGVLDAPCTVEVMTDVVCLLGGLWGSDNDWQGLSDIEHVLSEQMPSVASTSALEEQPDVEVVPEAWMNYPAMWEFIRESKEKPTNKRIRHKTACTTPVGLASVSVLPLPGEVSVTESLSKRSGWSDDGDQAWPAYFFWRLRGGRWTDLHKGIAFDCYAAYVRQGTVASDFIAACPSLKPSVSFSIRAYGDVNALLLARSWIHRMFFLFSAWLESCIDSTPQESSNVQLGAYEEPEELTSVALTATRPLLARIRQIRGLSPR